MESAGANNCPKTWGQVSQDGFAVREDTLVNYYLQK